MIWRSRKRKAKIQERIVDLEEIRVELADLRREREQLPRLARWLAGRTVDSINQGVEKKIQQLNRKAGLDR